LRARDQP
jgi:ribonuclease HI